MVKENIEKNKLLLASMALSAHCDTNDTHDNCLRFSDVELIDISGNRSFVYFKNSADSEFRLDCTQSSRKISCELEIKNKYYTAGFDCGGGIIPQKYVDDGTEVDLEIEGDVTDEAEAVVTQSCTEWKFEWEGKGDGKKVVLQPGIDNFYKNVEIYFDKETTSYEEKGFLATLVGAGTFVAGVMKKYIGLQPLSDTLYIYLDHHCNDEEAGKTGLTFGNIVYLKTQICPPVYGPLQENYYGVLLAHELTHSYIFPRLADDPGSIIHEGLTTYMQVTYAKEKNYFESYATAPGIFPISTSNQLFPDEPASPVLFEEAVETGMLSAESYDGSDHEISINEIGGDGVYYSLDGGFERWTKFNVLDCQMGALCLSFRSMGEKIDLLVFDASEAKVKQVIKAPAGCDISPGVLYLLPSMKILWGTDQNGIAQYFEAAEAGGTICEYPSLVYTPFDQELEPPLFEQYYPAVVMILGLEQMHRKNDPLKNPNAPLKIIGDIHRDFRNEVYDENKIDVDVNIYHQLCSRMGLPMESCLAYFEKFGIDTDKTYFMETALCMPK